MSSGNRDSKSWDPVQLFAPDLLLPEQLESGRPMEGVRALLWSVFADGVLCYVSAVDEGRIGTLEYREAERWIFRPDSPAITSFSSLCELFGLEPRALRQRLLKRRAAAAAGPAPSAAFARAA